MENTMTNAGDRVDPYVRAVRDMEMRSQDIDARRIRAPHSVELTLAAAEDAAWLRVNPLVMPKDMKISITFADGSTLRLVS